MKRWILVALATLVLGTVAFLFVFLRFDRITPKDETPRIFKETMMTDALIINSMSRSRQTNLSPIDSLTNRPYLDPFKKLPYRIMPLGESYLLMSAGRDLTWLTEDDATLILEAQKGEPAPRMTWK